MPTADTDLVVATQLAAAGISLTLGTNVFHGPVRPAGNGVPEKAVFCLATGGPPPGPYAGASPVSERFAHVQCRVRSAPHDYAGGKLLARSVRDALHCLPPNGYTECKVIETEPLYVGQTEKGHHEWAVNVELWYEE